MSVTVRAVVFDVGETVLDRTREYQAWAAFFGVPAHTFSAVFGAMISAGATVHEVVERFGKQPFAELLALRGAGPTIDESDVYPDVRACLAALRQQDLALGICGNQTVEVADQLRSLGLDVDFIASSQLWGVAKPSELFFGKIAEVLGVPAKEIVYVGDQLDNDVTAARRAGLNSVRIKRGPWGLLTTDPAVEASSLGVIDSLAELAPLIARER